MKKLLLALLILCLGSFSSRAVTSITGTSVSGHWTLAGSPYKVYSGITIAPGKTLVIDPGVKVLFQGPYNLTVEGSLYATGTSALPIVFDVSDTTGWHNDSMYTYDGAWRGIYFNKYTAPTPDSSALAYCSFSHMKWSGVYIARNIDVRYCTFTNNLAGALQLKGGTGSLEVSDCKFYNNSSHVSGLVSIWKATADWHIHNNDFYNNTVMSGSILSCDGSTILFSKNKVYNNTVLPALALGGDGKILEFKSSDLITPCYAVVSENQIYANQCGLSAAIHCTQVTADLYRNFICNNNQSYTINCGINSGGGAMYLMGNSDYGFSSMGGGVPSMYTVRNNIIANNYSAFYGGGIYVFNGTSLIVNNTIVNNKAPRGSGIDLNMMDSVTACVRNNIIAGNVNENAAFGKGNINVNSLLNTKLKFDHNLTTLPFKSNVNTYLTSPAALKVLDSSFNIIGANVGLLSPTSTANVTESALTADFRLSPGSPCIDHGINSASPAGSTDYAGHNRINGSVIDIGAFEYEAMDASPGNTPSMDTMFKYCCAAIPRFVVDVPINSRVENIIDVYPNPASNIIFITTPEANGMVQLNDLAGKQLMSKNVSGKLTSFDIHTLPRGFYNAIWHSENGRNAIQKIIIE